MSQLVLKHTLTLSIGLIAALGLVAAEPAQPARYNILFLMCDQHRPDALSRYGDKFAVTPALDSLAASGFSFRQDYCQAPTCILSRNAILTGVYAHTTGPRADRNNKSFAQVLRANGYKAACFGKLHTPGREDIDWDSVRTGREEKEKKSKVPLGKEFDPKDAIPWGGVPSTAPETARMEWHAKEDTIAFMKENRDGPWVVECSLHAPHPPFTPPLKYWNMIDRSKLSWFDYPKDDLDDTNPRNSKRVKSEGMFNLTDGQIRSGMQGYYGSLAFSDAMFAEVLKALDDLGLREKTLVIYTSDHGEMLGAHHLWGKTVFFDPSVRVPLIMRLPGIIPEGKESQALVESIDIFPTIMDIVGLETPETVRGKSLLPVLTGRTDKHRDVVHSEDLSRGNEGGGMISMQFDGRYKVVDNGPKVRPELYDVQTDPREITNLEGQPDHRERLETMLAELRKWSEADVAKHGAKVRNPNDDK